MESSSKRKLQINIARCAENISLPQMSNGILKLTIRVLHSTPPAHKTPRQGPSAATLSSAFQSLPGHAAGAAEVLFAPVPSKSFCTVALNEAWAEPLASPRWIAFSLMLSATSHTTVPAPSMLLPLSPLLPEGVKQGFQPSIPSTEGSPLAIPARAAPHTCGAGTQSIHIPGC